MWYWEDVIHYDCELYDGVIQWTRSEPVPLPDQSVDEVYIGGLLIELDSSQHLTLAKELDRIIEQDGTKLYEGSICFSEFFYELRKFG